MASASGRNGTAVNQQLFREPWKFDFFQAVRLLERIARERSRGSSDPPLYPVGRDRRADEEVVRFRSTPSFSFSSAQIVKLAPGADPGAPAEMQIAFLGLIGAAGVLPQHYTQLVIDRVREKDVALREFLHLFEHRTVSLFYRAWEKYRFPVGYERTALQQGPNEEDSFTAALYALIGLGGQGLRHRHEFDDEALLFYSGQFAHRPPNVSSLEAILNEHFEIATRVIQFCGQWLYLGRQDQSRLPTASRSKSMNNCLGQDVIVGERVWNVENRFRVRLGPMPYARFLRFIPTGDQLKPFCQFVRMYAGRDLDFDIQPVLEASEVPPLQLGSGNGAPGRLGWNTWLISRSPAHDASDAIFVNEGLPSARDTMPNAFDHNHN